MALNVPDNAVFIPIPALTAFFLKPPENNKEDSEKSSSLKLHEKSSYGKFLRNREKANQAGIKSDANYEYYDDDNVINCNYENYATENEPQNRLQKFKNNAKLNDKLNSVKGNIKNGCDLDYGSENSKDNIQKTKKLNFAFDPPVQENFTFKNQMTTHLNSNNEKTTISENNFRPTQNNNTDNKNNNQTNYDINNFDIDTAQNGVSSTIQPVNEVKNSQKPFISAAKNFGSNVGSSIVRDKSYDTQILKSENENDEAILNKRDEINQLEIKANATTIYAVFITTTPSENQETELAVVNKSISNSSTDKPYSTTESEITTSTEYINSTTIPTAIILTDNTTVLKENENLIQSLTKSLTISTTIKTPIENLETLFSTNLKTVTATSINLNVDKEKKASSEQFTTINTTTISITTTMLTPTISFENLVRSTKSIKAIKNKNNSTITIEKKPKPAIIFNEKINESEVYQLNTKMPNKVESFVINETLSKTNQSILNKINSDLTVTQTNSMLNQESLIKTVTTLNSVSIQPSTINLIETTIKKNLNKPEAITTTNLPNFSAFPLTSQNLLNEANQKKTHLRLSSHSEKRHLKLADITDISQLKFNDNFNENFNDKKNLNNYQNDTNTYNNNNSLIVNSEDKILTTIMDAKSSNMEQVTAQSIKGNWTLKEKLISSKEKTIDILLSTVNSSQVEFIEMTTPTFTNNKFQYESGDSQIELQMNKLNNYEENLFSTSTVNPEINSQTSK